MNAKSHIRRFPFFIGKLQIVRGSEVDTESKYFGQYLSKTDLGSVKGASARLEERVADLERKLTGLGRLVGK